MDLPASICYRASLSTGNQRRGTDRNYNSPTSHIKDGTDSCRNSERITNTRRLFSPRAVPSWSMISPYVFVSSANKHNPLLVSYVPTEREILTTQDLDASTATSFFCSRLVSDFKRNAVASQGCFTHSECEVGMEESKF